MSNSDLGCRGGSRPASLKDELRMLAATRLFAAEATPTIATDDGQAGRLQGRRLAGLRGDRGPGRAPFFELRLLGLHLLLENVEILC